MEESKRLHEKYGRKGKAALFRKRRQQKQQKEKAKAAAERHPPRDRDLRTLQWNCLAINAQKVELARMLEVYQPHVVCLQETNLFPDDPAPRFPGYDLLRADRPGEQGGGLIILLREGLQWSPDRRARPGLHAEDTISEALACTVYPHRGDRLPVLNLYVPPRGAVTIHPSSLPTDALICADANAHHADWDSRARPNPRGKFLRQWAADAG
eukprot:gene19159-biopygen37711